MCCTFFSIWGIITLVIMGILFNVNYAKLDNGLVPDHSAAAVSSYIGAAIYALFVLGCGGRVLYLRSTSKQEKFVFDDQ